VMVRGLLETVISDALEGHLLALRDRRDLYELVRDEPRIQSATRTFRDLVTECLLWAAWLRASGEDPAWVRGEIDRLYAQGYLLVPVFYGQLGLGKFRSPDEMASTLLHGIDVERETGRWKASAKDRALWTRIFQADLDRRQGRLSDARILYEDLRAEAPEHPRVLYGWGSLLFSQADYAGARKALEQAAARTADETWVAAWSWIRLGWIADIEGDRAQAMKAYRAAVDTGSNYLNARAVAERFLEEPFEPTDSSRRD